MPSITEITLRPACCQAETILPLLPAEHEQPSTAPDPRVSSGYAHIYRGTPPRLPVGTRIGSMEQPEWPAFQVVGRVYSPGLTLPCPLLRTMHPWPRATEPCVSATASSEEAFQVLPVSRSGYAVACITLSDKGYLGQREDRSGPALLVAARSALPLCHEQRFVLPDDPQALRALVLELASQGYDLILTTGGTGLAPRDRTPEALVPILTRRLNGFEQHMLATSLQITPRAAIARTVAGTVETTMVIALPGSLKAATENIQAILPALPHALEKLHGDPADCGG